MVVETTSNPRMADGKSLTVTATASAVTPVMGVMGSGVDDSGREGMERDVITRILD